MDITLILLIVVSIAFTVSFLINIGVIEDKNRNSIPDDIEKTVSDIRKRSDEIKREYQEIKETVEILREDLKDIAKAARGQKTNTK